MIMRHYDLIDGDSSVLKEVSEPFNFISPQLDPESFMVDLSKAMVNHVGIGLSAIQCGIPLRVFAIGNPRDAASVMCFFNPSFSFESAETSVMTEGCLSFPNWFIKINRSSQVRLRYQDVSGEFHAATFNGLTAHCVQHEIDHLNGILFKSRAHPLHLAKAKDKVKKYAKLRIKNKTSAGR